jgi:Xaa-Pro aminopeptidase
VPALLLAGDTERSAAMRHEIPIPIGDPFLFAELDGRKYVLTSPLESGRIREVLPEAEQLDYVALGFLELANQGMSWDEAGRETEARAVRELGIREAIVPGDFPLGLADRLRQDGVALTVDDSVVNLRRRAKSPLELDGIRVAARAAEAALAAASEQLARAVPSDGELLVDGKLLLAEDVRATLRRVAAEAGAPCPPDITVASIRQGQGHEPGYGPLPAGLPIHVDIWPRHELSACWADMARTFIVGDPVAEHAEELAEFDRLVRTTLEQAKAAVRPGITGRELHAATCDTFEAAGYATQRTAEADGSLDGFRHSLGHGVGLEVHEPPALGLAGRDPFVVGDVVAIEPGLFDSRFGGVIFEDLVLVTEGGSELLTNFPYDLQPR